MIRCTLNIPLVTHDRGGDDEKKKKFTSSVEKKNTSPFSLSIFSPLPIQKSYIASPSLYYVRYIIAYE